MKIKEQNINLWDFKDILMSVALLTALMFLYFGVSLYLSLDENKIFYAVLTQIIFYIFMVISVFYFVFIKKSNSLSNFFAIKPLFKNLLSAIKAFFVIIVLTTLIDTLSEKFINVKSSDVYADFDTKILFAVSFVGIFFAPFAEEIFFRGFIQPVCVDKFGINKGVLLTVLTFSLMHFLYVFNISALLSIIAVGFVLSYTKEKTGSVIPCIIAHFLNNLVAAIYMNYF